MKIRHRMAGMFGVLGAVAALTSTLSGAAHADTSYDEIETNTDLSAKVLDVNAQDPRDHARIDQWEKNNGTNQVFKLHLIGSGAGGHNVYQIFSFGSQGPGGQMCVEVRGGGLADITQIDQTSCATGSAVPQAQLWNIKEIPTGSHPQGWYNIIPYSGVANHVSLCMDVRGGSSDNGAQIIQYHCNGQNNQAFWSQMFEDLWIEEGSVNGGWI